jgi:acetoin:2,6-dichlorophenolindophenol oxidoreductase subunit beta
MLVGGSTAIEQKAEHRKTCDMPNITMRQAINHALAEEMRANPALILLGQDIGAYGGTFGVYRGLFGEFGPDRVRDGPLCESATVGLGIGLAISGMRSVVEVEFMDFTTVAMDQIVNQAAKMHYFVGGQLTVPLLIRTPIASRMGMGPQHAQSLEAWFMHIPGLKIAIPSNAYDAKGLLKTALRDQNPVLFIENVKLYGTTTEVPEEQYLIPFGKARVVKPGTDVTLVAISGTVPEALAAADALQATGISVEVLDPRTLNPLDDAAIGQSVRKTGRLVITHDGYRTCGVAAEIAQRMMEQAFDYLKAPIVRVTGADVPIPSGALHLSVVPDQAKLIQAVRTLIN